MTDDTEREDYPGRTPGQAEGTDEDVEGDGRDAEEKMPHGTPDQAEGEEEDV